MALLPVGTNHGRREPDAYAIVDDDVADELSRRRWRLAPNGYVKRGDGQFLHRLLLGLTPGDPREGDHENRNKLDNQRHNLRVTGRSGNLQNTQNKPGASGRRGVTWYAPGNTWQVRVKKNRKVVYCRYFHDLEEAAQAYLRERARLLPLSPEASSQSKEN